MDKKYNKNSPVTKESCTHDHEHKQWSRRSFLHTLGLAGGVGLTMGGFGVEALASHSLALTGAGGEDRILVLIRLKGGNDGLNMIVPVFDYGRYKTNRPTIGIAQADLIGLDGNGMFAMPKTMQKLKPIWDEGHMKIINSVGYPDHNLSHFTSSDIWNSANQGIEMDMDKSGWLGRYLLNQHPDYLENLPEAPGAIKINSGSNIAYQNPDRIDLAVNFSTPDRLIEVAQKGFIYDTVNLPDACYYGEQVGYLRSILNITYKYAPVISEAYGAGTNVVAYSNNELSRQLAIVARLIKGQLGTRLYMVTLDGFDTHENQNMNHPRLMAEISSAVSEFYEDLQKGSRDQHVLSMTFSEFGRRVRENEGGTDHGAAAPVLFFGHSLEGNGILGKNPDLGNTDLNGNLKHDVDFRSVYATVLESWLCLESEAVDDVIGGVYDRLPQLGLQCVPSSVWETRPLVQNIRHGVRMMDDGSFRIQYSLARAGNVSVEVYTILGQKIETLFQGYQSMGDQAVIFTNKNAGLTSNMFIYVIQSGGSRVSGKLLGL